MKFALPALAALAVSLVSPAPAAQAMDAEAFVADLNRVTVLSAEYSPLDLIDWKVGDSMDYAVKMVFGNGKSHKEVTQDEGTALWLTQVISILGQNQKIEALINKADGKVLKLIQNGKEMDVSDEKPEIISSEYTSITVPAGKFECFHIIAKTKSVSKLETWVNPMATCMDGSLKTIMNTQFGAITLELTGFKKMP